MWGDDEKCLKGWGTWLGYCIHILIIVENYLSRRTLYNRWVFTCSWCLPGPWWSAPVSCTSCGHWYHLETWDQPLSCSSALPWSRSYQCHQPGPVSWPLSPMWPVSPAYYYYACSRIIQRYSCDKSQDIITFTALTSLCWNWYFELVLWVRRL